MSMHYQGRVALKELLLSLVPKSVHERMPNISSDPLNTLYLIQCLDNFISFILFFFSRASWHKILCSNCNKNTETHKVRILRRISSNLSVLKLALRQPSKNENSHYDHDTKNINNLLKYALQHEFLCLLYVLQCINIYFHVC